MVNANAKQHKFDRDEHPTTNALGRHILVPEVARTHHVGRNGSSMHLVNHDKWFPTMLLYDSEADLGGGDGTGGTSSGASSGTGGNGGGEWGGEGGTEGDDADAADHGIITTAVVAMLTSLEAYRARLAAEIKSATPIQRFSEIPTVLAQRQGGGQRREQGREVDAAFVLFHRRDAWAPIAHYLGLWPAVPLDVLPIRGSFDGVVRFHWNFDIPAPSASDPNGPGEGATESSKTKVQVVMLLMSDDAPLSILSLAPPGWPFAHKSNVTNHRLPPPPRDQSMPPSLRAVRGMALLFGQCHLICIF